MATAQSVSGKKTTSKTAAPKSVKIGAANKASEKKLTSKNPAVKKLAAETKIVAQKKNTPQAVKSLPVSSKATGQSTVAPEERYKMIAAAAYLRAERRGFASGRALNDWIEAEAEIDAMLKI